MKRIFAIVLCLIMSVSILSSCLAISAEVESGEIKARVSDLGTTADSLFRTNKTRSISVVMLIIDLADKLNDGPLDVSSILAPARYGCWIGITDNKKNLIVISPYDEQKSIITIDYNPKGIIKYYIQDNTFNSEQEMTKNLPDLFTEYDVAEYYEVTPDEVISAFSELGMTLTVE